MGSENAFPGWDQEIRRIREEEPRWRKYGITEPWTIDVITSIVRGCEYHSVLEVGCSLGYTAERLLAALPEDGEYLGIEIDVQRVEEARDRLADDPRADVIFANSLKYLPLMPPDSFDFAWIDGNHEAEHVEAELREAVRIVREGGLVAMHDVTAEHLYDLLKKYGGVCIPTRPFHRWGGIGLIEP